MIRNATKRARVLGIAVLASALLAGCTGGTEFVQTTFYPVSGEGRLENAAFMNTFWWTMAILFLVSFLVIYVVWRFRERPDMPHPEQIHGNTKLEILWTVIPAIVTVFIMVPAVKGVFALQRAPVPGALEIEVIGHQWWWEFRYPSEGVVTAQQFYVPTGREVHLRLSSADVIHSFWVPRIVGKRDVLPQPRVAEGENPRPNHIVFTADSAGHYRGQCAEYCGEGHAIMATQAVAVSPAEFDAWVQSMKDTPALPAGQPAAEQAAAPAAAQDSAPAAPAAPATLEEQGRQIFLGKTCVVCHSVANTTARGMVGPNLTRFGARPYVGAGARPNTLENVEQWIRNPQSLKAGALMPGAQEAAGGFPPTGLTDEEIRAVAAWLVSLK
ncbi:MAG: cytochrome c oxidase subunit II [Gemmatimonadota bacterium]|jgi:cytochrome c oxidase subunit 2